MRKLLLIALTLGGLILAGNTSRAQVIYRNNVGVGVTVGTPGYSYPGYVYPNYVVPAPTYVAPVGGYYVQPAYGYRTYPATTSFYYNGGGYNRGYRGGAVFGGGYRRW